MHAIKCDVVGKDHVRMIVRGEDGARFKAIAFRAAEGEMGQALLNNRGSRRFWLAGRPKVDDWSGRREAELIVEDAIWAD